ncbi:MAG: Ig-like domain-containing protein, partial [Proteobacteria bacterium]|nr:Ig-like domain-containing protein [Pseudomonadota bacterium]
DTFQYQLNDGDNSPSNWATVTFHVPGPPVPPISVEDNYEVLETSVTKHNVLDNDPRGVLVTKVVINGEEHVVDPIKGFEFETELGGGVRIMQDGTFTYVAPVRDHGDDISDVDHFQYIAKDASGNLSEPTMVNIDILDTVPIANDDNYALTEINIIKRFHGNVMDSDIQSADYVLKADEDSIQNIVWQVRADENAAGLEVPEGKYNPGDLGAAFATANDGWVWINQDGSFEYRPPSGAFKGEDSFQYQLNDGDNSPSNWATVTLHVPGPPVPTTVHDGGAEHGDLSGTDGVVDVFKWSLADLGHGDSVTNTVNGFNASEGDKLDLRDLLREGDDYLFNEEHLSVSSDNSGNTVIAVTPVDTSAPSLNIVIEGIDLTGGNYGQDAIDQMIKNGNLVDDK